MTDGGSSDSGPIEWVIRPYEGAGPIDFNMTHAEVEAILGPPTSQGEFAGGVSWQYLAPPYDVNISFDQDGMASDITFYGDFVGVVAGVRLTGLFQQIIQALRERGHVVRDLLVATRFLGDAWSGDTICDDLGVSVRRELKDEVDIRDACAFRRGWWEYLDTKNRERLGLPGKAAQ